MSPVYQSIPMIANTFKMLPVIKLLANSQIESLNEYLQTNMYKFTIKRNKNHLYGIVLVHIIYNKHLQVAGYRTFLKIAKT